MMQCLCDLGSDTVRGGGEGAAREANSLCHRPSSRLSPMLAISAPPGIAPTLAPFGRRSRPSPAWSALSSSHRLQEVHI
jgi:hypothetical protein